MSGALHFSPSHRLLLSGATRHEWSILNTTTGRNLFISAVKKLSLPEKLVGSHFEGKLLVFGGKVRFFNAWAKEGSLQDVDDSPVSVELEPICTESQFDRVIAEAQQLEESVVIVWMATWCRKCIFLKPKLEKLAADYYPRLRFYCVDVNNVPHKLVARAGVTKMPTIQLWKDCEKQGEVTGGHKAHFVINEVREMIEDGCTN
ncbi:hypothetical protein K2173_020406 [Erythroxylum novogranatense]|uniref:Thioredoxin domain-containing protein n=1 Tax=Erythroxylum novogranatense TaxID=1862640 RepID=A0AAV8TI49_9ROSI|nr:hypothetical protein K2173_020406 [Erythroxylum novogranatense]